MFRIGIDATPLPPNPVGAGRYIVQLIRTFGQDIRTRANPIQEGVCELVVFAQRHGRELIGIPERPGLRWVIVPDRSPARRLVWEQTEFPGMVRSEGIDLLHSLHYTRPLHLSCRSVVTFHDMTFFLFPHLHTRAKRIFFPLAMRWSARTADMLLAVSESTRQDTIRILGVPPEKIVTTPLGVGEEFRPVENAELKQAVRHKYDLPERFLLFVGLVEPRKNLPLLLEAYHSLVKRQDTPPLVIAGRFGWMVEGIFEQIEMLGLKEKVQFTGYVTHQDLPIVYNLADVFVYPSRYEGFGLPPLEAMACGTPVITTSVSSMPEHVGDAGILVPPGDMEALTGAMARLAADESLREELGKRGRERSRQYTWTRTVQLTCEAYRRVLRIS
jgi:glycosyltransferase involved in cell wall biosynthesis